MSGHHHGVDHGDSRVLWAVIINVLLTVFQIVGGIIAGSLALIADAIHNLSDAISLGIAFAARKIARTPPDTKMTFGYVRSEIVAALINYTTLIVIGIYLVYEALWRFIEPQTVDGWLIVIIACIAFFIDVVTALLTYRLAKGSINIRAAFLHNLADALGSVAVIIAGSVIIIYGWTLIDPIITLMIAGYILWLSFREITGVIHMLMLGTPDDIDIETVRDKVLKIGDIEDMHHIHLWEIDEHTRTLEAHVVITEQNYQQVNDIKHRIKACLVDNFNIEHSTIEFETDNPEQEKACTDKSAISNH